jgi:hypothetical protein
VGKLLLKGLLELAVACAKRVVGPEHVPEFEVVAPLGVVYGYQKRESTGVQAGESDRTERTVKVEIAGSTGISSAC